jgi:hypothetical protein
LAWSIPGVMRSAVELFHSERRLKLLRIGNEGELKAKIRAVEGVKLTQKTRLEQASGLRWSMEHEILVVPDDRKLIA